MEGIRLVRPPRETGRVIRPDTLVEIADLLGAEPADVLLGECFIVVEGPSDGPILSSWARRLGIRFDRLGIRLVDAKGWSKADVVAELLRLTYPSARFHIVLDGGSEISQEVNRIEAQARDRLQIHQLRFREIEAYFSEDAIRAWFAMAGGGDIDTSRLSESRDNGEVARWLHGVAHRSLGRPRGYDKVKDGPAIAALMSEAEIEPEIKALLVKLVEA